MAPDLWSVRSDSLPVPAWVAADAVAAPGPALATVGAEVSGPPAAMLALACLQTLRPAAGRPMRLIGDLTYATYLIHFPIQLYMILFIRESGISADFASPVMLLIYLAAVVLLAIPVHYGFELPAQQWLRQRLLSSPPAQTQKRRQQS